MLSGTEGCGILEEVEISGDRDEFYLEGYSVDTTPGGSIDVSGDANFSRSVFYTVPAIKTSAHVAADGDHILMFDLTSAGGNQSITLGNSGQTINTNRVIVVKNVGTSNSVDFISASQIDGAAASSTVLAPGEKITLIGTPLNGWQSI